MKAFNILIIALFLGPIALFAQNQTWNGPYYGNLNGTPTTLNLAKNNGQLSGNIDASGYIYNLQGTVNGNQSSGTITDSQTLGQLSYSATMNGQNIQMTLSAYDPYTGQTSSFDLSFSKTSTQNQNNSQASNQSNEQLGGDMRLVGLWRYTDSYSSGEYSFATQYKLQINSDGTYLYGDGKVAGGGPGVSGSSGGGDVSRGKWKAQNNTIYINEGYGWQPYAGYYVEATKLMMKFGDGSKQIWYRIQ